MRSCAAIIEKLCGSKKTENQYSKLAGDSVKVLPETEASKAKQSVGAYKVAGYSEEQLIKINKEREQAVKAAEAARDAAHNQWEQESERNEAEARQARTRARIEASAQSQLAVQAVAEVETASPGLDYSAMDPRDADAIRRAYLEPLNAQIESLRVRHDHTRGGYGVEAARQQAVSGLGAGSSAQLGLAALSMHGQQPGAAHMQQQAAQAARTSASEFKSDGGHNSIR